MPPEASFKAARLFAATVRTSGGRVTSLDHHDYGHENGSLSRGPRVCSCDRECVHRRTRVSGCFFRLTRVSSGWVAGGGLERLRGARSALLPVAELPGSPDDLHHLRATGRRASHGAVSASRARPAVRVVGLASSAVQASHHRSGAIPAPVVPTRPRRPVCAEPALARPRMIR